MFSYFRTFPLKCDVSFYLLEFYYIFLIFFKNFDLFSFFCVGCYPDILTALELLHCRENGKRGSCAKKAEEFQSASMWQVWLLLLQQQQFDISQTSKAQQFKMYLQTVWQRIQNQSWSGSTQSEVAQSGLFLFSLFFQFGCYEANDKAQGQSPCRI